jgi:hypothetical protein
MTIENVVIESTMLGTQDHGIMTFMLMLKGDGWGCGFGGYCLDTYDKKIGDRVGVASGLQAIMEVLKTLEVDRWEDLKGTFVRCETEGWGGKVTKIGHLIKNQWFSLKDFFSKETGE